MEIEDLRNLWKRQATGFEPHDEAQLAAMIRRSSSGIVSRLKRSVWFELAFTIVAGIALLVYALTLPSGGLKWISIAIIITFFGYCVYYIKKLALLHKFDRGDSDINANLTRLIASLKSYLRFYRRSYTVLYPVYFILGLLFGALERNFDAFYARITQPSVAITLLGTALLLFVAGTWFTRWYLRKLYGNHLERLENLLRDLNQD